MKIIDIENNRILEKDNNEEVKINNNDIIEYTGIYYKIINDIIEITKIETSFVGIVESSKYRYDSGTIGVYIKPLYIFDKIDNIWKKIINYKPPIQKYFLYPHLLLLPQYDYYNYYPVLYFLHTCKNVSLNDFNNVTLDFKL